MELKAHFDKIKGKKPEIDDNTCNNTKRKEKKVFERCVANMAVWPVTIVHHYQTISIICFIDFEWFYFIFGRIEVKLFYLPNNIIKSEHRTHNDVFPTIEVCYLVCIHTINSLIENEYVEWLFIQPFEIRISLIYIYSSKSKEFKTHDKKSPHKIVVNQQSTIFRFDYHTSL